MTSVKNTLSDGDVLNRLKEIERILGIRPNTSPSATQELPDHWNKEDTVPSSISTLGGYLSATIKQTKKLERQGKKDKKGIKRLESIPREYITEDVSEQSSGFRNFRSGIPIRKLISPPSMAWRL